MQWRIGDVTVTKVVELEVTGGSRFILPQATREAIQPIAWLRPHFADEDGRLRNRTPGNHGRQARHRAGASRAARRMAGREEPW